MTNKEILLQLMTEYPKLPVVPLVDTEVVAAGDYAYWMGELGRVKIAYYYLGREYIHIKDEDDEEDVLNDLVGCKYSCDFEGRDIYELSDEEWDKLYKSIPWTKAIIVRITV